MGGSLPVLKPADCPFVIPRALKRDGILSVEDLSPTRLDFAGFKFRCIEIDPPWQYKDRGYNGFQSVQKYRIHTPYPTMSLPEIWLMGNGINRIAHERCHLWMWVTKDFLKAGLDLVESWGWEYKQTFTWIKTRKDGKPTYGMGHWGRNGTEFLILAVNNTRNNKLLKYTTTPNYFFAPRTRHSEKPEVAYEEIIKPNSPWPRVSIFCRKWRPGFVAWGNQVGL